MCLGARSHAREDGFLPAARSHVERYLLRAVFGLKVDQIARSTGHHRSTIYRSIRIGRELTVRNARALGLSIEDFLSDG